MKKYTLMDTDTKVLFGRKLFRIKANISFGNVKEGDLGGYVEKEKNLDMSDNAWVSGNAKVSGNAEVYGDAEVSGNAEVSGDAKVSGDAWVYGNAEVYGDAWVSGDAKVSGNAKAKKSPIVLINACKWNITKTDNMVQVGYVQKTPEEWIEWLDGKDEFETKRGTIEFKKIEKCIRFLCEVVL